jgi:hypothetical protein
VYCARLAIYLIPTSRSFLSQTLGCSHDSTRACSTTMTKISSGLGQRSTRAQCRLPFDKPQVKRSTQRYKMNKYHKVIIYCIDRSKPLDKKGLPINKESPNAPRGNRSFTRYHLWPPGRSPDAWGLRISARAVRPTRCSTRHLQDPIMILATLVVRLA